MGFRFSLKFAVFLIVVSVVLLVHFPRYTNNGPGRNVLSYINNGPSSSTPSKPSMILPSGIIVYCNWANTFDYQSYIWKSIYQARLLNPTNRIVVITTGDAINSISLEIMETRVKALNIELVDFTHEYRNSSLIKKFEGVFFVHANMVPIDGNPLFVLGSIVRIPIISVWMARHRVEHVFHLENDNTLYQSVNEMTATMLKSCKGKVRFAAPKMHSSMAVLSLVYFADADAAGKAANFIVEQYAGGRSQLVSKVGENGVNDMGILALYIPDRGISPDGVTMLPCFFPQPEEGTNGSCIWNAEHVVYDSAVMGQYFGGTHTRPNEPWYEDWRNFPAVKDKTLDWKPCPKNASLRCPYISGYGVGNLHIHSKQLEKFSSLKIQ